MTKYWPFRDYPLPTRKHPPRPTVLVPDGRRKWHQRPNTRLGLALIGAIVIASLAIPRLSGCSVYEVQLDNRFQPPSAGHWLGTDQFGRDVLCRALYGAQISLPVGALAVVAAVLPGLFLGLLAGYYGGWLDGLIDYLTNVMLAFPGILLALLFIAWLGPGLANAMLAIGLSGIPRYIRMVRSRAAQLERAWFVRAARIVGSTDTRILVRHILPNVLPTVVALATIDVAWAILNAAALSFLGLGAQPPRPEWGNMIDEGREFLRLAPWISLAPGTLMALAVLGINLLGEGLRDALDPRAG